MTTDMFAMIDRVTRLVEEGQHDEAYKVIKDSVDEDGHGFARVFLSAWISHLAQEGEAEQNKFAEILIYLKEDFPELATGIEQERVEPEPLPAPPAMPLWLAPFDKPRPTTPVTELVTPEPVVEPEKAEHPAVEEEVEAEPEVTTLEVPVEAAPTQAEEPPAIPSETEVELEPQPAPIAPEAVQEPEELENLTLTFYEWQMSAIRKAAHKEHVHEGALLTRMLETRKLEPLMWSRYRHGSTSSPTQRITIAIPHKTKVTIEKDKDFEGIKTTTKYVRKVLFGARAEKA